MRRREANYVWVTWLSRLMAGEVSCTWAAWFRTHYVGYARAPSDFQLAVWTAQHARMLDELVADRAARGETSWQEAQCAFRVKLSPTLTIGGKPDLVTFDPAAGCVVYDVKTGKRRHSDVIQVMLYMLCLPCAYPRLRGKSVGGCVVYAEGEPVRIPAGAADDAFKKTARYFADLLDADDPPRHVPSAEECRFCDITRADCSQRIESLGDSVHEESPTWTAASIAV